MLTPRTTFLGILLDSKGLTGFYQLLCSHLSVVERLEALPIQYAARPMDMVVSPHKVQFLGVGVWAFGKSYIKGVLNAGRSEFEKKANASLRHDLPGQAEGVSKIPKAPPKSGR